MSQSNTDRRKRKEEPSMSSFPNPEGLRPQSQDVQMFSLHSSRDYGRRAPRVQSGERYERHGHSSNPIAESSRARHWKTVMGKDATFDKSVPGSSSTSLGNMQQSKHHGESTRQDHLRVPRSSATTNDPLLTQHPGRQYDSAWRPSRPAPPKPFVCDQCPRRFERRGHLESHIDAVHRLRQPYECDYQGCGKTFSHRSSLSRHIKGVHEKNRYRNLPNSRSSKHSPQGSGSTYGMHDYRRPRS